MSLLDSINKPVKRNPIITITGDAGVGKTSLGAEFPAPIFIRAEDGIQAIDSDRMPDAFPVIESVEDLMSQLGALVHEEHDYQTLVIDSTTQLEQLFIDHVVANDPKKPKSINTAMGGFGAGLNAVSAMHGRVRKACGILNSKKNMTIVFIAHSDVSQIDLPDSEPFSKYELRLSRKSVTHYVDNVDLVLYLKLQTFTRSSDDNTKAKAVSTGQRIAIVDTHAAHVSKNRYGLTGEINVNRNENPFLNLINQ